MASKEPEDPFLEVSRKRLRGLKKRLGKIEQLETAVEQGKVVTLEKEQQKSLEDKPELVGTIKAWTEAQDKYKQFNTKKPASEGEKADDQSQSMTVEQALLGLKAFAISRALFDGRLQLDSGSSLHKMVDMFNISTNLDDKSLKTSAQMLANIVNGEGEDKTRDEIESIWQSTNIDPASEQNLFAMLSSAPVPENEEEEAIVTENGGDIGGDDGEIEIALPPSRQKTGDVEQETEDPAPEEEIEADISDNVQEEVPEEVKEEQEEEGNAEQVDKTQEETSKPIIEEVIVTEEYEISFMMPSVIEDELQQEQEQEEAQPTPTTSVPIQQHQQQQHHQQQHQHHHYRPPVGAPVPAPTTTQHHHVPPGMAPSTTMAPSFPFYFANPSTTGNTTPPFVPHTLGQSGTSTPPSVPGLTMQMMPPPNMMPSNHLFPQNQDTPTPVPGFNSKYGSFDRRNKMSGR